MAFVDEIEFHARAGKGGDGVVRWRREKFIPKGGPAGGDGGRGGNVYIKAVRDNNLLARYRHVTEFEAEDGGEGEKRSRHGSNGEHFTIDLPVGSIVTNKATGETYTLVDEGETFQILKGGVGGFGNEHFKSSTNVTPKEWTPGTEGEEADFHVELQLYADIGLVGLPNAGKSSLLNTLTNARSKTGDYAFTTLDPHLGTFYGYVLADIPGIIEGASEGKGLGSKFLRHIKRTKTIVHLISFENELNSVGGMEKAYAEIRKELESYGQGLAEKEELIVLSKTDVLPEEERDELVKKKLKAFKKHSPHVYALTLFDDASVKVFSDALTTYLNNE